MTESRTNRETDDRIDLMKTVWKMLKAFRRLWWAVILIIGLCAGGYTYMKVRSYTPMYRATATFTVSSAKDSDDISTGNTAFNSSYAQIFASTFPYIINNDVMREVIKEDLGTSYVNGSITASTTEMTNLVTITVTSVSSEDALAILESVMTNYPQVAKYVLGDTCVEILKKPGVSDTPYNSLNVKSAAVKGLLIGILLAGLLLMICAFMDSTITTRKEMQEKLHIRCLGVLPELEAYTKKIKGRRMTLDISDERTPNNYNEAVRALRTHVLQALKNYPEDKVIMITSTVPGEGKSTVSMNLAKSIAHNGSRVILVDADLRRQTLRRWVDQDENAYGLGHVLRGKIPWYEALTPTGEKKLKVMTGKTDSNAAELLDSDAMVRVISAMKKSADYVIIDTPPGGLLADAHVLANVCDCALYVVKPDKCHAETILYSLENLSGGMIHVLGGVLNGMNEKREGSQYGYGRYGRYGKYGHYGKYGYGEKK